ncbi:MAG: DNA starvation/stationary phase protection protein [Pseudomonadota bacterium]
MSNEQAIIRSNTENPQAAISQALAQVLADTYILALKTQGFHWNVMGPQFVALHDLFETQYRELFEAGDEIAERIRARGEMAPGSYRQFVQFSTIEEEVGTPNAQQMVTQLGRDHRTISAGLAAAVRLAEEHNDPVTAGLLTDRLQIHDKTAWMLEASAA